MNIKNKLNELEKVRSELHELVVTRGAMLGLSHQDPNWSEAKAHNLGTDVDRLQEKEREILQEITDIKHSPEFIQDLEAKKRNIETRRAKLLAEYEKLKVEVYNKRAERAQAVIDGADPMKVADALYAQQDRMEVISLALENLNIASTILETMGEDVPYQPAHTEDLPRGQKLEIPPAESSYQRVS